jgi:deazaflavin-dependent oxidoreductase (nitroreductase family)
MLRASALVIGGLLVAGAGCWVVFVVAMRTNFRPVLDRVRRLNRALINPDTLKRAGQQGATASVVHHVGRKTGTPYRTPVVAVTAGDGFVIALPYRSRADWVQNVLAAGSAVVEHDGEASRVDRPAVVGSAVAQPCFPRIERWEHRVYGVREFLWLRHEEEN